MIAVWLVLTAATWAVNDTVVEPEGMMTLAGTETALLFVARATFKALVGAALRDTLQVVVPAAAKELLVQDSALRTGNSTAVEGGAKDIETDFATLPCVAVMMPVWPDVTLAMDAENFAEDDPSGTVTEAGTLMAGLLLES